MLPGRPARLRSIDLPLHPVRKTSERSGKRAMISLIIPPSSFLLDERVFPSLGVLRVAAVLEEAKVPVEVLDLTGVENYLDVCRDYFGARSLSHIGITSTTPQFPFVKQIAKLARLRRPAAKLILGGPHATLCHAGLRTGRATAAVDTIAGLFDTVVLGDGEKAIFEAIKPDAPKVIDADDRKSPMFLTDDAYEDLPLPARHLIDISSYRYSIEGSSATSLISQMGCPMGCSFCGGRNSHSLRVIRTRSVQSVVDEIEYLYFTYGYTGFMFYDDELNISKNIIPLMNELVSLQTCLNVEFRLRGFIKAELFTDAQAAAMYRAGFRWILTGFEAAHPLILGNINKRATVEDNTRCVETAHRHGLKVKALMSIGHPGETESTVSAIRNWLIRMKVDDFDCTVISAYPGTPYYDEAVPHDNLPGVWTYTARNGDRLYMEDIDYSVTADYYKGSPDGGYRSYVFTDHLSAERIVHLRDYIEREVRAALRIPFNQARRALRYEHSSGGHLPRFILRKNHAG